MGEDVKAEREPYSIERIEKELKAIEEGLMGQLYQHIRCIASMVGNTEVDQHPVGPKDTSKSSEIPMLRIFERLHDIKEIVNQFDIHMNNLGHELHPSFYDKLTKEPR